MEVLKIIAALGFMFPTLTFSEPLTCEAESIAKDFGGTNWLVSACTDDKSIVVVSAPGNPEMPFYFFISPKGESYNIVGEGSGNKNESNLAFKALKKLTNEEILKLI